jgi:hypothetical protein
LLDESADGKTLTSAAPSEGTQAVISSLKAELASEPVPEYTNVFESEAAAEEILVGIIPQEEVERREAELQLARLKEEEEQGGMGVVDTAAVTQPHISFFAL